MYTCRYVAFFNTDISVVWQGALYPGISAMWGQWAPPMERSRLAMVSYTGNYYKFVVSLVIYLKSFQSQTFFRPPDWFCGFCDCFFAFTFGRRFSFTLFCYFYLVYFYSSVGLIWPKSAFERTSNFCNTFQLRFIYNENASTNGFYVFKQVSVGATLPICLPPPERQRTDGRKLVDIPLPEQCIWPRYNFDLSPLTLKTITSISTHITNKYFVAS